MVSKPAAKQFVLEQQEEGERIVEELVSLQQCLLVAFFDSEESGVSGCALLVTMQDRLSLLPVSLNFPANIGLRQSLKVPRKMHVIFGEICLFNSAEQAPDGIDNYRFSLLEFPRIRTHQREL